MKKLAKRIGFLAIGLVLLAAMAAASVFAAMLHHFRPPAPSRRSVMSSIGRIFAWR